jgi:hypothetical protein
MQTLRPGRSRAATEDGDGEPTGWRTAASPRRRAHLVRPPASSDAGDVEAPRNGAMWMPRL